MSHSSKYADSVRFDRTLTLGLFLTIIVQTAGAFMWLGATEARLSSLEVQMGLSTGVAERLARLEGQTTQMAQSLSRIEHELIQQGTP